MTANAATTTTAMLPSSTPPPVLLSPLVRPACARAQGAKMVCQIWHCGRVSHESYQPEGRAPIAPSALACPEGECFTMEGPKVCVCTRDSWGLNFIYRSNRLVNGKTSALSG